jgi:hypothetical protein
MPKKKVNIKALRTERSRLRAKSHLLHGQVCDMRHEFAIVKKALDSEAGPEMYLRKLTDAAESLLRIKKETDEQIIEVEKELPDDIN